MGYGRQRSRKRGVSSGAVWSPTDISQLNYWWKTDTTPTTITETGIGVSNWLDEVSALDLAQITDAKRPLLAANHFNSNLDGVQFDGSTKQLATAVFTTLVEPITLAFIVQCSGTLGTGLCDGAGSERQLIRATGANWQLYSGANLSSSTAFGTGVHYLVTLGGNGASSYIRADGVEIAAGNSGTFGLDRLTMGFGTFVGEVGEIIVCSGSALSAGDLDSLETYLSGRSGV